MLYSKESFVNVALEDVCFIMERTYGEEGYEIEGQTEVGGCVSGSGVIWLIERLEGHTVICAPSCIKAHSLECDSPSVNLCVPRGGEGFNVELNTCCWRRKMVSAVHMSTALPDAQFSLFHIFCQTLQLCVSLVVQKTDP